jgi:hypothetical protein
MLRSAAIEDDELFWTTAASMFQCDIGAWCEQQQLGSMRSGLSCCLIPRWDGATVGV